MNKQAFDLLELLSSSSSSDEHELYEEIFKEKIKVPKIKNYIENVVHNMSDEEFKKHFRLCRITAYMLHDKFRNSNCYTHDNSHGGKMSVSSECHILHFLWFAGNKCALRDIAQRFNVSVSSAFRQIDRVINFLLDIGPEIIKFPKTHGEKENAANEFRKISGFPGVLGCIDCTSIHIRTPMAKLKSTYVNRHDTPALTLQGIYNHRKQFIDVFTGTPGKIHDARVLRLSDISDILPQLCGSQYHLLGDGAYNLRTWLLTPYKDYGKLSKMQKLFNTKLSTTRVTIENSFGLLKGRFRQLQQLEMHTVNKLSKFIIACCILHNLCIENHDYFEVFHNDEIPCNVEGQENEVRLRQQGEAKRSAICNTLQYL